MLRGDLVSGGIALPCFSSRRGDWSLATWVAPSLWGRHLKHKAWGYCCSAAQQLETLPDYTGVHLAGAILIASLM